MSFIQKKLDASLNFEGSQVVKKYKHTATS